MRTHGPRNSIAVIVLAAIPAGCVGEISGPPATGDTAGELTTLEGDALTAELESSPTHKSSDDFVRIGVIWDADRPRALQFKTSIDGESWTDWQSPSVYYSEIEDTGSFVGEISLDSPARYYRIRAWSGSVPSYARIELLTETLSASIEDGDDPNDEDGPLFARRLGPVNVVTRAEWGSRNTRCTKRIASPYRMAIHHTAGATNDSLSPAARMRQIQRYHMDVRGWCDIGYHYIISRDGRVWEARPSNLHGAHAGGANNGGNLGISVMGTYTNVSANRAQVESIAGLVAGLADANDIAIKRSTVKGHRDYKATECPGRRLYGQLGEIRSRAMELQASGGGGTPPPPPTTGVTVKGILYAGNDTSARIAGATIEIGGRTTTSSASGVWSIGGVSAGAFSVTARASGYTSKTVERTTVGDLTWASFGLAAASASAGTATLQGVIYRGTNSSDRIANATVELSCGKTIITDANGFYKITNAPEGPITVTASAPGTIPSSTTRSLIGGEVTWASVGLQ